MKLCALAFLLTSLTCTAGQTPYLDQWSEYVKSIPYEQQPSCQPVRYVADPSVPFRGVTLLLHGFTACPQQFDEWAPLIASSGFDVLVPLLPGHGAVYSVDANGTAHDDLQHLPTDPSGYLDFSRRMNQVMRSAPGERVLSGLSLGGAAAVEAGNEGEPAYDRQLIMVPLLAQSSKKLDFMGEIINRIPILRDKMFGWGAGCEEERAAGRQGICQFTFNHAVTAQDFGKMALRNVRKGQPPHRAGGRVQVVFDWEDPAVSVEKIQTLYSLYDGKQSAEKSICSLPQDKAHSFLSKWDTPTENKWWLGELACRLTSFLSQSPVGSSADLDAGGFLSSLDDHVAGREAWAKCDFDCTNVTCPYERDTTLACPLGRAEGSGKKERGGREHGARTTREEGRESGGGTIDFGCFVECASNCVESSLEGEKCVVACGIDTCIY